MTELVNKESLNCLKTACVQSSLISTMALQHSGPIVIWRLKNDPNISAMQASPSPRSGKHLLASSLWLSLPIIPPNIEGNENGSENGMGRGNGNGNKENDVTVWGEREDEMRRMTMSDTDFMMMMMEMLI